MMFLIRAAFWIGVVAWFMPGDPAADALTGSAREAVSTLSETDRGDAFVAVASVCLDNPALCTAGAEAVDDAQGLAVEGLNALAAALDERDASASN